MDVDLTRRSPRGRRVLDLSFAGRCGPEVALSALVEARKMGTCRCKTLV